MASIGTVVSKTWDEQEKWVVALVCGISAGFGALIANIVVPHIVESTSEQAIIGGLFAGGAVVIGVVLFSIYKYPR